MVGVPDFFSGEVVKAYFVLKDLPAELTEDEVIECCSQKIKYVPKRSSAFKNSRRP